MSDYRVRVIRRRGIRQKFHVQVLGANGEKVLTSENYLHLGHALNLAEDLAERLGTDGFEVQEAK